MTTKESKPPVGNRPRERSPGYPAINLERAISRTQEIWNKDKQYPTPIDAVVKHWGYKSLNGPASLAIAALKRFGLIIVAETKGDRRITVTDLAVEILNHPNEETRRMAVQKAALKPTLHKELWSKYGANLPSVPVLKWNLTHDMNFTESGAEDFIRQYQQTISFAKLADTEVRESGDEDDFESNEATAGGNETPISIIPLRNPQRGSGTSRQFDIPLPGGSSVVIVGNFPLNEQEWNQFLAVLAVMKPGLVADVSISEEREL